MGIRATLKKITKNNGTNETQHFSRKKNLVEIESEYGMWQKSSYAREISMPKETFLNNHPNLNSSLFLALGWLHT